MIDTAQIDAHQALQHVAPWVQFDLTRHLGGRRNQSSRMLGYLRNAINNMIYSGVLTPSSGPHDRITIAEWHRQRVALNDSQFRAQGYLKLRKGYIPQNLEDRISEFISVLSTAVYEHYTEERLHEWMLTLTDRAGAVSEMYDMHKEGFVKTFGRKWKQYQRENQRHRPR